MGELLELVHDYLIGNLPADDLVELVASEWSEWLTSEADREGKPELQVIYMVTAYREGMIDERALRNGLTLVSGLARFQRIAERSRAAVKASGAVPIHDSKVYYA